MVLYIYGVPTPVLYIYIYIYIVNAESMVSASSIISRPVPGASLIWATGVQWQRPPCCRRRMLGMWYFRTLAHQFVIEGQCSFITRILIIDMTAAWVVDWEFCTFPALSPLTLFTGSGALQNRSGTVLKCISCVFGIEFASGIGYNHCTSAENQPC